MAKKKKKTLPKNFKELIEAGDLAALQAVFDECEVDARSGYDKETALHFWRVPDELVRWLVGQGLDINTATHTYKRTPLYEQASVRYQPKVDLLLELGADMEAADYSGNTPLHAAAGSFNPGTVQTLIAHGANIHAENREKKTPLSHALARCRGIDIANMARVAALLLDAGAKITPDMPESVRRIGKDFEFHREDFNKDYLAETDAGLARLYQLFSVEPAAKQRRHDGVSPIAVTATDWRAQYSELWDFLVPSSGAAQTVQGEVIRIAGRVAHEIMDNGGANWDADFRKMLDALAAHLGTGTPLAPRDLAKAAELTAALRDGYGDDEPHQLTELAVRWVLQNPKPTLLEKPHYRR